MGLIRLKNATSGQNWKLPVKYPPLAEKFSKIPPPLEILVIPVA